MSAHKIGEDSFLKISKVTWCISRTILVGFFLCSTCNKNEEGPFTQVEGFGKKGTKKFCVDLSRMDLNTPPPPPRFFYNVGCIVA